LIERIEGDPSFRMAERVSPQKVGQVRAKGAPPSAVARRATLDEPSEVKKMPPCEQWLNSEAAADGRSIQSILISI
jgi:hypothetical protein